jgi:hypothetical protein
LEWRRCEGERRKSGRRLESETEKKIRGERERNKGGVSRSEHRKPVQPVSSQTAQKKVLTTRNFWQSDSADCETDSADCAQTDDADAEEVKTGSTGFHQGKTG